MFICAPHVCSAPGGHTRTLGPLGLELQMVVSCLVGVGMELGSPARVASA